MDSEHKKELLEKVYKLDKLLAEKIVDYIFENYYMVNEVMYSKTSSYIVEATSKINFTNNLQLSANRKFGTKLITFKDGKKVEKLDISLIYSYVQMFNQFKLVRYESDLFATEETIEKNYSTKIENNMVENSILPLLVGLINDWQTRCCHLLVFLASLAVSSQSSQSWKKCTWQLTALKYLKIFANRRAVWRYIYGDNFNPYLASLQL